MRRQSLCILSLDLALLVFFSIANCHTALPLPSDAQAGTPGRSEKTRTDEHQRAINRARDIASRLGDFTQVRAKVPALGAIADIIWNQDEAFARRLLQQALSSLPVTQTASPKTSGAELTKRDIFQLRNGVLTIIARHDSKWAKELLEAAKLNGQVISSQERYQSYEDIAIARLKDDPAKAADYMKDALSYGLSPRILSFLYGLKVKDEAAADNLYMQALSQLEKKPSVGANELLAFGSYVFAPDLTAARATGYSGFATPTVAVGRVTIVTIWHNRLSASRNVAKTYLNTALTILGRHYPDPQARQLYYIAGYQLVPRVESLLPERAATLRSILQSLASQVPADITDEHSYASLRQVPPNPDPASWPSAPEMLSNVETLPQPSRDMRYLSAFHAYFDRTDVESAFIILNQVSNTELQAKLSALAYFLKAKQYLSSGNVAEARTMIEHLPSGPIRIIVRLGLLGEALERGFFTDATENATASLDEAKDIESVRAGMVTLAVSGMMAKADQHFAVTSLQRAVNHFNDTLESDSVSIKWQYVVNLQAMERTFSLSLPNIKIEFSTAIKAVAAIDFEAANSSVNNLKREDLKGIGLVSLVETLLVPYR